MVVIVETTSGAIPEIKGVELTKVRASLEEVRKSLSFHSVEEEEGELYYDDNGTKKVLPDCWKYYYTADITIDDLIKAGRAFVITGNDKNKLPVIEIYDDYRE